MANPAPLSYQDTLNKMANLDELSKFVVTSNAALEGKRGQLVKTVSSMQLQLSKVRDQIDNIKSKGATATTQIKQVIKDADAKQVQSLQNIKSSITAMLQMDKLETAVKNLGGDINSIAGVAGTGTNPDAAEFKPKPNSNLNPNAAEFNPKQQGGYTYGKSRKRGKGRRKRTKNLARSVQRNIKSYNFLFSFTLKNIKYYFFIFYILYFIFFIIHFTIKFQV